MEIIIGNRKFSSKASCTRAVQKVLHGCNCGSKLVGKDFVFIMDLLRNHPRPDKKIGCGIEAIFVEQTKYGKRGFYALRKDGTRTDFSYIQCITPSSHIKKLRAACRTAIWAFIVEFKDYKFSGKNFIRCPISNEIAFKKDCVVHHKIFSFEEIFCSWIKERGIVIEIIKLGGFEDNCESVYFLDKVVEKSFVDFHNERAVLQVLSKNGHKMVKE